MTIQTCLQLRGSGSKSLHNVESLDSSALAEQFRVGVYSIRLLLIKTFILLYCHLSLCTPLHLLTPAFTGFVAEVGLLTHIQNWFPGYCRAATWPGEKSLVPLREA